MLRIALAGVIVSAVLCGCGGSGGSNSKSSTSTTTAGTSPAFVSTCSQARIQALGIGLDAGSFSTGHPTNSQENKAASDGDTLSGTLTQLKGETNDPTKQAKIDQYVAVVGRFTQGVRLYSSGDLQGAVAQLTGIGTEFGQMLSGLKSLCGS